MFYCHIISALIRLELPVLSVSTSFWELFFKLNQFYIIGKKERVAPRYASSCEESYEPFMQRTDSLLSITNQDKKNYANSKTILIVDDEPINFLFLEAALLKLRDKFKAEFYIHHALNGFDALEIINNHGAVDLVFLDINMPGIDGEETCVRMKKLKPEMPIVAQTALKHYRPAVNYFEDILYKPIALESIHNIAARYLVK